MEPHARALAALGRASAVELCSAHGPRTILVGEDGQPADHQTVPDCCAPCLAPSAAPPPTPLILPVPTGYALSATAPERPGLPPLPPRAPPQLPRAPPFA
jgi:hypothetical protein